MKRYGCIRHRFIFSQVARLKILLCSVHFAGMPVEKDVRHQMGGPTIGVTVIITRIAGATLGSIPVLLDAGILTLHSTTNRRYLTIGMVWRCLIRTAGVAQSGGTCLSRIGQPYRFHSRTVSSSGLTMVCPPLRLPPLPDIIFSLSNPFPSRTP